MNAPFLSSEYDERLNRVRASMSDKKLDALIIGDPANMNWLTGFDAWSFYVPQVMLIMHDTPPIWLGRKMDAGAVTLTTYLDARSVRTYTEDLVQRFDTHPMKHVASIFEEYKLKNKRIGFESDVYFFSYKATQSLMQSLPESQWVDADLLVNWCRCVKSNAEIEIMGHAARIANNVMHVATEKIIPGMRQCDLAAAVVAAQIEGVDGKGGDMTALSPLVLAGEAAATAHPIWTEAMFEKNQTIALELGGAHKRYNAGLARTIQLGTGPEKVYDVNKVVNEGLEIVLDTIRPGITGHDVHKVWNNVLKKYNLSKESRIGYSIGVGYTPDWGEHTVSLRADDHSILEKGMTLHVMLGMWMDDWGIELSETIVITTDGCRCLTDFPREIHSKT